MFIDKAIWVYIKKTKNYLYLQIMKQKRSILLYKVYEIQDLKSENDDVDLSFSMHGTIFSSYVEHLLQASTVHLQGLS